MQRNLAVGLGAQPVSASYELALNGLVSIELAIDDDPNALVFARDGLIAGGQVDDAEPGMAQSDLPVGRDPLPLPVGTAMVETLRCPLNYGWGDYIPARK